MAGHRVAGHGEERRELEEVAGVPQGGDHHLVAGPGPRQHGPRLLQRPARRRRAVEGSGDLPGRHRDRVRGRGGGVRRRGLRPLDVEGLQRLGQRGRQRLERLAGVAREAGQAGRRARGAGLVEPWRRGADRRHGRAEVDAVRRPGYGAGARPRPASDAGGGPGDAAGHAGAGPAGGGLLGQPGQPRREGPAVEPLDERADAPLRPDVRRQVEGEHEAHLVEQPEIDRTDGHQRELAAVEREGGQAVPLRHLGREDAPGTGVELLVGGERRGRQVGGAGQRRHQRGLGHQPQLQQRGVEGAARLALPRQRPLQPLGRHHPLVEEEL